MSFPQIAFANADWLGKFVGIYQKELGDAKACSSNNEFRYRVCSDALKNEGNSPFILHHGKPTDKVAVLFHGLSDSPFFFRSIAKEIHQSGATVVVALLPGHGKLDADGDMEDDELAVRWQKHVTEVMSFSEPIANKTYIGGFSTGGALATQYVLANSSKINGLLLFSGALALDESVESMAGIWGIKTLAKFLDGEYESAGPNPYKYPGVAGHSAFMLTDVIFAVREEMENGNKPNLPIFTAHSMADTTTPWRGIEDLLANNAGPQVIYQIAKSEDVCHADLVVNAQQIIEMQYDESMVEEPEKCTIPQANPKHNEMLQAMMLFLKSY